jgi:transcriptional regulator with PAS, ATPase and Fis domain
MRQKFDELVEHLMDKGFFLEEAVEILERSMIERGLARNAGNQSAAAKDLGIHRNTLQRKMVEFEISGTRRKPPTSAASAKPRAALIKRASS